MRMHQLQRESKIRYAMIEYASGSMVSFDRRFRIHDEQRSDRMSGSHLDKRAVTCENSHFGEIIAQMDPPSLVTRMINQSADNSFGVNRLQALVSVQLLPLKNELGESSVLMTVEDITAEERRSKSF